jgi:hypothetical protein
MEREIEELGRFGPIVVARRCGIAAQCPEIFNDIFCDVPTCAGCRFRYPRKETVLLEEGNHDNLVFFHGERVCKPCARKSGVSY